MFSFDDSRMKKPVRESGKVERAKFLVTKKGDLFSHPGWSRQEPSSAEGGLRDGHGVFDCKQVKKK